MGAGDRTRRGADKRYLDGADHVAGGTARSILTRPLVARDARFSPEGDLIAYISYESGRPEISVQTVDGTAAREVVSVGGGTQPVWRLNGAELLFVDLDGLLRSVAVHRTGSVGRSWEMPHA